ncbi:EscU/YscU/HrcU family type III secretion system export apparatus switch protein [Clostridium sp. Mt-5]|uniref:EscU/YscU/HrcU family type III secretion system export apparatus switch protein n=1 Tax=Clostridium moutaii TaxID=3240932 RepID=A0ABV4BKE9_9CLOT
MNGRKKAAALKYEESYDAPIVTAAGIGQIADNILNKARESSVPIVYDKELADLLSNVDIGDDIPIALYDAVAKVIAYVIDIDKNIGR